MSRRAAAAVLAWAVLGGCDAREGAWEPAPVIAVAERVREANPERCLLVARGVGPELVDPMPFAVYQGLVTSGFLVDTLTRSPHEAVVLLGFRHATRDGAAFNLATTLAGIGETPERRLSAHVRWRVACEEGRCAVVDSTLTASAEEDDPRPGPLPEACP